MPQVFLHRTLRYCLFKHCPDHHWHQLSLPLFVQAENDEIAINIPGITVSGKNGECLRENEDRRPKT